MSLLEISGFVPLQARSIAYISHVPTRLDVFCSTCAWSVWCSSINCFFHLAWPLAYFHRQMVVSSCPLPIFGPFSAATAIHNRRKTQQQIQSINNANLLVDQLNRYNQRNFTEHLWTQNNFTPLREWCKRCCLHINCVHKKVTRKKTCTVDHLHFIGSVRSYEPIKESTNVKS